MDRQRGIGLSVSGTERSVSDDGGRHIVPRYGVTRVAWLDGRDETTAERSGRNGTHLVRTEETISVNANSIINRIRQLFAAGSITEICIRVNEDYMKKVDLIYEPREVAPRVHLHDVILSTLFSVA